MSIKKDKAMKNKKPTIIIGADGIEYVISGGKIRENCSHQTVRNESSGNARKEVCHDCGKVLVFNSNVTSYKKDSYFEAVEDFYSQHGRYPKGMEIQL